MIVAKAHFAAALLLAAAMLMAGRAAALEKRQGTFDDIAESARNLRPLVSLVNALR
jgi:hypothetical protein